MNAAHSSGNTTAVHHRNRPTWRSIHAMASDVMAHTGTATARSPRNVADTTVPTRLDRASIQTTAASRAATGTYAGPPARFFVQPSTSWPMPFGYIR